MNKSTPGGPSPSYSKEKGYDIVEFGRRHDQLICRRALWKEAIYGGCGGASLCFVGIMTYTKLKGLVRPSTKSMLIAMVATFGAWLYAEQGQNKCRLNQLAQRAAPSDDNELYI